MTSQGVASAGKCDNGMRATQPFYRFMHAVGVELLRVMKPGAFLFMTMTPRQDCLARVQMALAEAGFNIGFTSLYWTFASGFPKAVNMSKAVDRRATNDGVALALSGSYGGFQPKPAVEVVIVAMKPLSEKTFVDQALKNGKGVTWLDNCRIPIGGEVGMFGHSNLSTSTTRFPANLLVSDDVLNDGRMAEQSTVSDSHSRYFSLDAWATTLPFLIASKASKKEKNEGLSKRPLRASELRYGSVGRPSSVEKRRTLTGENAAATQNSHPTVKPLKLISYLITLGSRPGDVVLDPFLGSGTTAVAAVRLGRHCIGIEREKDYVAIAKARLKAAGDLGSSSG